MTDGGHEFTYVSLPSAGGNLTPYGASANVVAMGIVQKEGHPMSFGSWLKLGAPFTLLTTGAAAAFLWFVWS